MKGKVSIFLVLLALGGVAAFWLVSNSRAATESPEYRVLRSADGVEIREYPALQVVTAPMDAGGMNGSFGKLFRFITGANETSQKIAMTTPVLIESAGERRTMSFILPKAVADQGAPKPAGANVDLGAREAGKFAVLRFGGNRSDATEAAAIAKLRAWLAEQKLEAKGTPIFAYYDPPWTPTPLRRNEVLIRVAE